MDSIRVAAKTVEDALIEASIQLGTSSDNIEYTVLDEGSRGVLFGIGGRDAIIEARRKISEDDLMKEIFEEPEPQKKEVKKEKKQEPRQEKKPGREIPKENKKEECREEKKEEIREEDKEEKKVEKDVEKKEQKKEQPVQSAGKKVTELNEGKETEETYEHKEAKAPKMPADPEEAKNRAVDFVKDVLEAMGLPSEVTAQFEDNILCVNIEGENMGILIGKRGQTLDSLQYLTSLVVNRGKSSYVRVKLDTEDYRARRKATLENLAKNIAIKVKKTRRPVFLEPMNPYERRIIHSALQNDPYVTTHSEGEEPYRKVVVTLKKDHEKGQGPEQHGGGYAKHGDHRNDQHRSTHSEIESDQNAFAEAETQAEQEEDSWGSEE